MQSNFRFKRVGQGEPLFFVGDILQSEYPSFDIAVALGVLDWLSKDDIDLLFKKVYPHNFLFSISEKVPSLTRILHSLYVQIAYGWKTDGYVPQYYVMDEILEIARGNGYKNIQVFRDKRLRFGAFLYQFD